MNKHEAVEYIKARGNRNDFSANAIYEGLVLDGVDEEEQKRRIDLYLEWRKHCNSSKLCFAYAISDTRVPASWTIQKNEENEERLKEIVRSLGFYE